jgi:serine/threonine-protein kinase
MGHYRIGEPLGEGGMGVVYRAVDVKLGRPVALKFLQRTADGQARARFLREARAASALDHPNIGTVYEIGEADGAPYLAMALYEGETLRARIKRGSLTSDESVAIMKQLCAALSAAHAAGTVHRDLKPANVMLLPDGTVKLLAFGLAKLTSIDESSLTRDGAILGTLAYMAPEQLKSADVDARADLWALGAMLYEMLCGQPPFGLGPAATVVGKILAEEPPPLPKSAPGDLAALARRLLSKRPERRLAGADQVGALLARRAAPASRSRRWLWAAASLAIAASAGAVALRYVPSTPSDATLRSARGHYASAMKKFDARDFDGAAAEFEAAYQAMGDPTILYNAGQSFRLANQYGHALLAYGKYLQAAPDAPNRAEVEKRIVELRDAVDALAKHPQR